LEGVLYGLHFTQAYDICLDAAIKGRVSLTVAGISTWHIQAGGMGAGVGSYAPNSGTAQDVGTYYTNEFFFNDLF